MTSTSLLSLFDLTGKTALVTGCNRGIGLAMAEALAEAGANILGVSASMPTGDSPIRQAVEKHGRTFTGFRVDMRDRAQIKAWIQEVRTSHPPVDILINNAGTIRRSPAAEHSDEDWDDVLAINLDAPFILAREFGKEMVQRGYGKVIFTASLLSFQGGIWVPGYSASKGAIASLVKALANEWAGSGVNVNAIAPGYVVTDNTEALRNDPVRSATILQRIPAGRWAEPGDFRGPVVFLASEASNYIHGTLLTVDGGWMGR